LQERLQTGVGRWNWRICSFPIAKSS